MKPKLFKLIITICWVISLFLFFYSPNSLDVNFIKYIITNTAVGILFFGLFQKYFFGSVKIISISFLFILSYVIVHFQIPLAYVLGYNIQSGPFNSFIWGDESYATIAVACSSIALNSFILGFVFTKTKKEKKIPKFNYNKVITLFTFLGIIFYFLFFITSGSYKYGNYNAGDNLPISKYLFPLFDIFTYSAIVLKSYMLNDKIKHNTSLSKYIMYYGLPLSGIVFWHILFSLFVGDRGPVIISILLYFGLYLVRVLNNKNKLVLISGFVIVSILFSVLGSARSRTSNDSFLNKVESSDYKNRYSNNFNSGQDMPGLSTLELALSVRCVNHVISNVPKNYDYKYGLYQLRQIIAVVPFLSGIDKKYISKYDNKFDGSANFVTYLIQGENSTSGDGTSPVADLYLDFGVYGVCIGFLLFGIFIKKAEGVLIFGSSSSLFFFIATMIFLSGCIYIGRGTFLFYFQRIIQMYIVINLFKSILHKSKIIIK